MGGKPKAQGDGEDNSTEKFFMLYKKICKTAEQAPSKNVVDRFNEDWHGDPGLQHIQKFHISDPIGWQGVRCIMEALRAVQFPHTKSIRLWNVGAGDEGTRQVCQYIEMCNSVLSLELMSNEITPLGCQFLGKLLAPQTKSNLLMVKLDHNNFGSEGLQYLAEGLSMNKTITQLSLKYNKIDASGADALFQILIYTQSALELLELDGNYLRNEGVIKLMKGLSIAKNLKQIVLADNQFLEEDDVLEAINDCMIKNQNLGKYDFKYNFISDYGVLRICDTLEKANHVFQVGIPERISKETYEKFNAVISSNKPKKGKKGKGKKKKK